VTEVVSEISFINGKCYI